MAAVGANDVIRARHLFGNRPLRVEAGPRVRFGEPVPRHETAELLGRRTGTDDDAVEVVALAGFEEQWNVGDRDPGRGGQVDGPLADATVDLGVDDCLELRSCGLV